MWNYHQPVNLIFGEGEVSNLAQYMKDNTLEKAYVLADDFLVQSGATNKLSQNTKDKIVGISSDVEPNPTLQNVESLVAKAKEAGADCLVAFGGGSAMDCAKAAAAALAENCTAQELLDGYEIKRALPIIAIPTTAGTGSEVTAGAVISDKEKGIKAAIFSKALFPTLAIVDPELTYTVPAKVTAMTGLDVLAHAFDAISSVKANEVTDALALKAISLTKAYLERAVKDGADKEARRGMAQASTIAGLAFSQTGTTASHACSYILTSKYQMPHGEACAFTLDAWLVINSKARPIIYDYAKELGFADVQAMADWFEELKKKFGMRCSLSEVDIDSDDIQMIAESSLASANMKNNVAQIGLEGVMTIFRSKKADVNKATKSA